MGPCHRTKTWSTWCSTGQIDSIISTQTRRVTQVHQRTFTEEDDLTIKKPLHRILLLHQEERQKIETSAGLSTSQQVDYPELLPLTSNSPARRQTLRMLTLHQIQHSMGL